MAQPGTHPLEPVDDFHGRVGHGPAVSLEGDVGVGVAGVSTLQREFHRARAEQPGLLGPAKQGHDVGSAVRPGLLVTLAQLGWTGLR